MWQPWASAVALGLKTIETRHWSHAYRGPLAIHAAKRWTGEERDLARSFARAYDARLADPPLGAIICVVQLIAIRTSEELISEISEMEEQLGNYGPKRFGWLLGSVQPLTNPVPFKGAQSFFDVPDDLLSAGVELTPKINVQPSLL